MGFDVLAAAGVDVRGRPLRDRLRLLEDLAAGGPPPLQLCPTTTDHAIAVRWMRDWAPVGVEGIGNIEFSGPWHGHPRRALG